MEDIQILIQNIDQSNLSAHDKNLLLSILREKEPDLNKFIHAFIDVLKIGKEFLKLFDIDIGSS